MIKAIIIDDEAHCIHRLSGLLSDYCSESVSLLGTFRSVDEGLKGIHDLQPQIIFLDVQLQDKSGFDLLKSLREINFNTIFTTAYDKYALQAFKFSALDYLLKPVDKDDLLSAIKKFSTRMPVNEESAKMEVLLHNLQNIQGQSKKISVPTVNGFIFLRVLDIVRCQSNINYTTLILKDKQKVTVAKTLKEFEELLTNYNFFRVHNSHLINLDYIQSYNKGKGGSVIMSDHSEIEVSTRRKDAFMRKLKEVSI